MGAQNANSRQLPDINETVWGHTPQPTVHNTIKYFTCESGECQGNLFKSLLISAQFLFTLPKGTHFPPLTKIFRRGKMAPHAGVVELVDSVDLGSNGQPCKFKSCRPYQEKKGKARPSLSYLV